MNNSAMPAGALTRALCKHLRPLSPTGRFLALGLIALCLFSASVFRAAPPPDFPPHYPAWWFNSADSAQSVFLPGGDTATEANYAPVNLGQLKWTATQTKRYLDKQLASVGGTKIDLDTLFAPMPPQGEVGSATRAAYDAAVAANYAPANLGQLKAVAKPFYDRLAAVGYSTRDYLRGKGYAADWASPYPWNPETPVDANYAVANLGQLKLVFGFDLAGFTPKDSEGGGGSDPEDPDPNDPGNNPNPGDPNAIEDSDGDGFSDHVESALGFDPKDPDSKPRPRYGIIDLGPMSDDEVPMLISEANGWVLTNKKRRWHKGVWYDQPLDVPDGLSIGYSSITHIGPAGEIAVIPPAFGMEGYYFAADGSRVTTTAKKSSDWGTYTFPYKFFEDGRTAYVCAGRGGDPYQNGGSICSGKRQIEICEQGERPFDIGGSDDTPALGMCLTIRYPRAMSSSGTMIYDPTGWRVGVGPDESRPLYADARGSVYAPSSSGPAEDLVFYAEANLSSINSENILVGDAGGQPVWAKDGVVHDLPQHPLLEPTGRANYINDMSVIAAEKHIWERSRDKDGNRVEPIAYDFPEKVAAVVDFNSGWTDGWKITGTNGAGQFVAIGYKIKEGQEKRTDKGELIIDHVQYTDAQGNPSGAIERHAVILHAGMLLSISLGQKPAGQAGPNGYYELTSDDQDTVYMAPHWKAGMNEKMHNYPVAYKRGSKMKVAATFQLPPKVKQAKIRAWGTDGVNIPETTLSISGGAATLGWTETSALPDAIKHYDAKNPDKNFKFTWEIQQDGGEWAKIFRATFHTVYVVKAEPATSLRQETLFWLACRKADGLPGTALAQQVTDKIWENFPVVYDKKTGSFGVTRVDGMWMCYYFGDNTGPSSTSGLLKAQKLLSRENKQETVCNGDCEAWSNLFMDVRRVHGLDDAERYYIVSKKAIYAENGPVPAGMPPSGLLIKNWKFDDDRAHKYSDKSVYINLPANEASRPRWKWSYKEVTEDNGIKGQGNSDPPSWFDVHKVVRIGNYIYDPSYGLKYEGTTWEESLGLFQKETIAGFWRNGLYEFPFGSASVYGYGIMKSTDNPEQELKAEKDPTP